MPTRTAKVAKRFRWDSAHRLPGHPGLCRNLHGHSYAMEVEFEGPIGKDGIVIDFKEIKNFVGPLVDEWDHATLVAEYDVDLLAAVQQLNSRYAILSSDSTAENMAEMVLDHVFAVGEARLREVGITHVTVRLHETETCYAEVSRAVG